MLEIQWQGRIGNIRRIVLSSLASPDLVAALSHIAQKHHVDVTDDGGDPHRGGLLDRLLAGA